jgi:hypothetical protein
MRVFSMAATEAPAISSLLRGAEETTIAARIWRKSTNQSTTCLLPFICFPCRVARGARVTAGPILFRNSDLVGARVSAFATAIPNGLCPLDLPVQSLGFVLCFI